jgi:ribose transport system permease protein
VNRDRGTLSGLVRLLIDAGPLLALLLLIATAAVLDRSINEEDRRAFLTLGNFMNILRQWAPTGVVAIGMTFVIISAGIDLSVGSMVALAAGLGILVMNACGMAQWQPGSTVALGVITILGSSIVLGAINGVLVSVARIAPFVATLSTLAAYRSIALAAADGGNFDQSFEIAEPHRWLPMVGSFGAGGIELGESGGRIVELPYIVVVFFGAAVIAGLLLRMTVYGLQVRAVGDNEKAAMYAALPLRLVRTSTYTFSGLMCGIAAVLFVARLGSVSSGSTGVLYELDAIAAVVIGGTRMQGGTGRIWGTVVGVMILGVIHNMLNMIGVGSHFHGLVKGAVIVAAVLVQRRAPGLR